MVQAGTQLRRIREGFVLRYAGGYFAGNGGAGHASNFIEAIRSRRSADLNAPILEGHVSSAVCHLGNLSYRLGPSATLDACREASGAHPQVEQAFNRLVQSLEGIGVDLNRTPGALGPWLETDPTTGRITGVHGGGGASALETAQRLARGSHREPYGLPA